MTAFIRGCFFRVTDSSTPAQEFNCAGGSIAANIGSTISISSCEIADAISEIVDSVTPSPHAGFKLTFSGGTVPGILEINIPADSVSSASYAITPPFTIANLAYSSPDTPQSISLTFDVATLELL